MTSPKITKKILAEALAQWAGKPAFEHSTAREAFALWAVFYEWAKTQNLDPLDKPEELLLAANEWRSLNGIKPSPRTQRKVIAEVFGADRLPEVRSPGSKKQAEPVGAAAVLKVALRDNRAGAKRCQEGIEKLTSDLNRYQAELTKLEEMEKALS